MNHAVYYRTKLLYSAEFPHASFVKRPWRFHDNGPPDSVGAGKFEARELPDIQPCGDQQLINGSIHMAPSREEPMHSVEPVLPARDLRVGAQSMLEE